MFFLFLVKLLGRKNIAVINDILTTKSANMSESDNECIPWMKRNLVGPLVFILAINLTMIIVGAKYDDPDLCKGQVKVF